MSKNISPQTKSFIILFTIAIVGTYFCLILGGQINSKEYIQLDTGSPQYNTANNASLTPEAMASEPEPVIDTTDWKTYTDPKYGFSFKYDPTWKIVPGRIKNLYYTLEIDPGSKYYNIKIYVSSSNFYVMDGLPYQEKTLSSGASALDVSDLLYGIKGTNYYYTFDLGYSLRLKPEFKALVNSASFN